MGIKIQLGVINLFYKWQILRGTGGRERQCHAVETGLFQISRQGSCLQADSSPSTGCPKSRSFDRRSSCRWCNELGYKRASFSNDTIGFRTPLFLLKTFYSQPELTLPFKNSWCVSLRCPPRQQQRRQRTRTQRLPVKERSLWVP